MKKLIAILLLTAICVLGISACSAPEDNTTIRIGYLTGPTGMGMAKLINDNGGVNGNEKYSFKRYEDPQVAVEDLAANNIDLICMPTNDAAVYYNGNKNINVLSINTLSSIFLVSDKNTTITSFAELEGKTIYTCKKGNPKPVMEYLIKQSGINATVTDQYNGKTIASPKELGSYLTEGKLDLAVVPEPILTSSLLTIKSNANTDIEYSIDLAISDVWNTYAESGKALAMGCIVGNAEFVKNHKTAINNFLEEYKASIEFVNASENLETAAQYIADAQIMAKPAPAKVALKNLHGAIAYVDGEDMKATLEGVFKALNVTLPDDDFYYEK